MKKICKAHGISNHKVSSVVLVFYISANAARVHFENNFLKHLYSRVPQEYRVCFKVPYVSIYVLIQTKRKEDLPHEAVVFFFLLPLFSTANSEIYGITA
jgi:surface polysaccharide O-acyltransferase-like enzyme